jgi:predicted transcriptional regulator
MESTNPENPELHPQQSAQEREQLRKQFNEDAQASWDHYQATGLHLTDEEMYAWVAKLLAGEDAPMPEYHT